MSDKDEIKRLGSFPHLRRGAQNAVNACLSVTETDVVTIVCDEESLSVAAALLDAIEEKKASAEVFILERLAPRPLLNTPGQIIRALQQSTVSIYLVEPREGEWSHRREILDLVKPHNLRHAHMIDVNEDVLCQGMLSDYERIARLNPLVIKKLQGASTIRITSPAGTDVLVTLSPDEPFDSSAGILRPGDWDNLPNGEVLTCPKSVDGIFVCDGIVPTTDQVDRFDLARKPLRFELEKGRVKSLLGGPGELAARVQQLIDAGTNVDRIGMFAVGTNFDLLMPIGNKIQDLFMPGAYLALGRSIHPSLGSSWTASAHRNFTGRKTTLEVDGYMMINEGRYDQALLAKTRA